MVALRGRLQGFSKIRIALGGRLQTDAQAGAYVPDHKPDILGKALPMTFFISPLRVVTHKERPETGRH
jgi:hypothetical protein